MIPGSLVECRRDGARAPVSPDELVENGYDSLAGNSTDSAIHEIGHVLDLNVIGARNDNDAHPYQFPAMRKLVQERHEIFALTARKDVGYVSAYSKVNAQENFAEHFWAYLRDPADFLARARREQADGHDLLMRKYRFMAKLVDDTPATMCRLSAEYLEAKQQALRAEMERERGERQVRQEAVLAEYLERQSECEATIARVAKRFGKPFHEFTREDYATYMAGLDLDEDAGLWEWSHVSGIPVLAPLEDERLLQQQHAPAEGRRDGPAHDRTGVLRAEDGGRQGQADAGRPGRLGPGAAAARPAGRSAAANGTDPRVLALQGLPRGPDPA